MLTPSGSVTLIGSTGVGEVGDLAYQPIPETGNGPAAHHRPGRARCVSETRSATKTAGGGPSPTVFTRAQFFRKPVIISH